MHYTTPSDDGILARMWRAFKQLFVPLDVDHVELLIVFDRDFKIGEIDKRMPSTSVSINARRVGGHLGFGGDARVSTRTRRDLNATNWAAKRLDVTPEQGAKLLFFAANVANARFNRFGYALNFMPLPGRFGVRKEDVSEMRATIDSRAERALRYYTERVAQGEPNPQHALIDEHFFNQLHERSYLCSEVVATALAACDVKENDVNPREVTPHQLAYALAPEFFDAHERLRLDLLESDV